MVAYGVPISIACAAAAVSVLFAVLSLTSRRPSNLGVTSGRLAPCPSSPNCVCSQEGDPAHHTEPIAYSGEDPVGRLAGVIAAMPRAKLVTKTDDYLHAEFTSLVFRFVDDVEFQVDRRAKLIHCRSASRAGHSDLGVNRRRIEAVRQAFDAAGR